VVTIQLDLPAPPPETAVHENKNLILDPFRRKWLVHTPEEWVRQWVLKSLVINNGFPAARIATEIPAKYHRLKKRSDALLYDEFGRCLMLMEFKASSVSIDENTMHQALTYNAFFKAPNILLSNGKTHLLRKISTSLSWLECLPMYHELAPCI
jgi:hypothetical protein